MSLAATVALPYWGRLACLSLASGAAAYAAGLPLVRLAAPVVLRRAARFEARQPERAAGQVLLLRLAPLGLAALAIVALCVPSYVWLEPRSHGPEAMSWGCLLLAAAGGVLLLNLLGRLAHSTGRTWRYARGLRRRGARRRIAGTWVRVLPAPAPAMAVVGTWRPQLVISEAVLAELDAAQMDAGLRHERAHCRNRDNRKRLLLHLAPVPGRAARTLETRWARLAEWAADDGAVAGDAQRSLALASALLSVARLGGGAACPRLVPLPAMSTLEYGSAQELRQRVERLLAFESAPAPAAPPRRWLGYALLTALLWSALQPTTLLAAHRVLERLVH